MCRSTDYRCRLGGDRLKIKAFFVRFSHLESLNPPLDSLTLFYLPRIDETDLEIDGLKIRPDSPAFVTLHRVVSPSLRMRKDVVFGSRERVRASEGVQFQVYLRAEKVVQGIFRRCDDGEWRLECKCALESDIGRSAAAAVEICVDLEGEVAMFEKVVLKVRRKKKKRGFCAMEEIPERREVDGDCDGCGGCCEVDGDSSVGDCGCSGGDDDDGGGETEVEGAWWGMDLGIWAVCLGVGFLVSKAAHSKTLRRKGIF
ncbi:uncharacterized protein LOC111459724 [Cucurbita moschata]|uniref:Uncharacterized protein LOC111459724 n=1 Tax=Cucurbita moschata TaxID=3662 RepID=A0A6J1H298_CUCMO|nr:uncharacterized protein LOC111459724 [Cucurbita moschata]